MKDKAVKILRGNQVTIALPLERLVISSTGQVVEEYVPDPTDEIVVNVRERQTFRYVPTIAGNVATFVLGADVPCGVYGVEVLITKADGTRLRSYRLSQIAIVENNERAGLGDGVEFGVDSVQLDAAAYIFAKGDKGDPFTYEDFTEEQLDDLADRIELTPAELAEIAEQVDLSGYVNGGAYDSQTKRILLTHDNVVVSSIDATAFIKDGMVSGVVVDNGYIVITFNTDAGKEDIRIPVSEVFDASLYFTKTESDARFVGKPFKVTLSSREEGGKTVWSSDKTFAEILAAYQAGREIVAIYDGAEVALNEYIGSGGFVFTVHYGNMVQQVFISENGVGVTPLTFVEESSVATINSQSLTRGGNITLPTPTDITELQTALANYCPIIEDTRTSEVATITGVAPFSELRNGQRIMLHLPTYHSYGNTSLQLTLNNGEQTPQIECYFLYNNQRKRVVTNDLRASGFYTMVYNSNMWMLVGFEWDTVYFAITQALINAGTATGGFLISPKLLRDNFYLKSEVDNMCPIIEDTRTGATSPMICEVPFSTLEEGQMLILHFANYVAQNFKIRLVFPDSSTSEDYFIYFKNQTNRFDPVTNTATFMAGEYLPIIFDGARWVSVLPRLATITQNNINADSWDTGLISAHILNFNFSKHTQYVEVSASGQVEQALEDNKFYKFLNPVEELTLTLVAPTGYGDVMGTYAGKFTASSTWDSIVVPTSVEEAAGNDSISAGKTYEFHILDNVIVIKEV